MMLLIVKRKLLEYLGFCSNFNKNLLLDAYHIVIHGPTSRFVY